MPSVVHGIAPVPGLVPDSSDDAQAQSPLFHLAAFDAQVWNPPEEMTQATPTLVASSEIPPTPPPPLAGPVPVLLAIVRDDSVSPPVTAAAMYDPQADRIVLVREGDQILGRTVLRVQENWAELGVGSSVVRLALEPEGGGRR
jgi:hypothetical protein